MRLIDADQFLSDESEAYMSAQNQITDEKLIVVNEVVHKKMQMLIADIPTVDAVPVVRCKKCVHHRNDDWCAVIGGFCGNGEWFCASGKRKENE